MTEEWWKTGNITSCANCGDKYIQDMPQDFLDDPNECHPDPRILCPECRLRFYDLHKTLEEAKMKPEFAIIWLAGQVDRLQEEVDILKIIILKNKILVGDEENV